MKTRKSNRADKRNMLFTIKMEKLYKCVRMGLCILDGGDSLPELNFKNHDAFS